MLKKCPQPSVTTFWSFLGELVDSLYVGMQMQTLPQVCSTVNKPILALRRLRFAATSNSVCRAVPIHEPIPFHAYFAAYHRAASWVAPISQWDHPFVVVGDSIEQR